MVNTRVGALLVAISCGLIPLADSRGEEQPPIVDEKVVSKFVDYLTEHDIRLAKIAQPVPYEENDRPVAGEEAVA